MFITDDNTTLSAHLPWETLEALVRGISSIDLTAMPMGDREEAYQFVLQYGYDMAHPQDAEEVRHLLLQAVRFIETLLLTHPEWDWAACGEPPAPALQIPEALLARGDVLDLILIASQGPAPDRHWACAILKVMHTLAHIQNGPLWRYFDQARHQILSAFDQILTPLGQDDGVLLGKLGGGRTLELFGFETKDEKTRESILVKLLCKKEHVAEAIWDLVGVRLITHTPAEALLAINILRLHKVIVFPNIIPSRSRNNLIDLDRYRTAYQQVSQELAAGRLTPEAFEERIRNLDVLPSTYQDFTAHNPSSSQLYRSIHITCRQLIRLKTPGTGGETRFFFPYEIQVLDKASYLESKEGDSAHSVYKRKQLATARRRVLGLLLKPTP
jgi:uncharacterized protein (TIGR04562 family)